MMCSRTNCFYCAKGQCVSLTVLSAERCERHSHHFLARNRAKPRPIDLSALRDKLEAQAPSVVGMEHLMQRQAVI